MPKKESIRNQQVAWDCHIRANHCVVMPQYERPNSYKRHELERNQQRTRKALSDNSRRKLVNDTRWMMAAAKPHKSWSKTRKCWVQWRVNMITLTLPYYMWRTATFENDDTIYYVPLYEVGDGHCTDNFFKNKLLHKFLNQAILHLGLCNYTWKVEPQQNGNIHAHIVSDTYMDMNDVHKLWNSILSEFGFMKRFTDTHGHSSPPSSRVDAIVYDHQLGEYISSEVAKKHEGRRPLHGRLWSSSYELVRLRKCKIEIPYFDPTKVLSSLNLDNRLFKYEIKSKSKNGKEFWLGNYYAWKDITHAPRAIYDVISKVISSIQPANLFSAENKYCFTDT